MQCNLIIFNIKLQVFKNLIILNYVTSLFALIIKKVLLV